MAVGRNVAVTFLAEDIETLQVDPEVVSQPDQLSNLLPVSGAAVRVTALLAGKLAEHVEPQEIPAGVLVRVPVPVPDLLTVKV